MIIDKQEILSLLPHRDPFLFVDKCEIIEMGKKAIGYKKFLPNEYFFPGHFPEQPIVPGVILIEALGQTSCIVIAKGFKNSNEKSVLFMSITKAKFRKPVLPNDEIIFEVNILNKVQSVYKFSGVALNNKTKVCEAEFTAMVKDQSIKEIL